MPRDVSAAFVNSLATSPIRPIELIRITYQDLAGLNHGAQFAIWPEEVILGRSIFKSYPWCAIGPYIIGNAEYPNVEITFIDTNSEYRSQFVGAPKLNSYPDIRGATVEVFKVNSLDLDDEADAIKDTFIVSSVNASDEAVVLRCDTLLQNPRRSFPPFTFTRRVCQWQFKDPLTCQWKASQGGNRTSCDKTMEGGNGCSAHGNIVNFGGYPGIADETLNTL
ncbi:MAG: hypothetical protein DRQ48_10790 [Gammaproteobacteria bacterium]|nr:MAG: hypothetical protein DRQ48_10790 [Gammaproteobacteria bacterium]